MIRAFTAHELEILGWGVALPDAPGWREDEIDRLARQELPQDEMLTEAQRAVS